MFGADISIDPSGRALRHEIARILDGAGTVHNTYRSSQDIYGPLDMDMGHDWSGKTYDTCIKKAGRPIAESQRKEDIYE